MHVCCVAIIKFIEKLVLFCLPFFSSLINVGPNSNRKPENSHNVSQPFRRYIQYTGLQMSWRNGLSRAHGKIADTFSNPVRRSVRSQISIAPLLGDFYESGF